MAVVRMGIPAGRDDSVFITNQKRDVRAGDKARRPKRWGEFRRRQMGVVPKSGQQVATGNFSVGGYKKEEMESGREQRGGRGWGGRGADTSSCGTIALQRKCDTPPVISLRTRSVSGHIVTDGQRQMKVSKNGLCNPPHTNFIYQQLPCLPADGLSLDIHTHTHTFIESLHWQSAPVMHFRAYTASVPPEERRVRSQPQHSCRGR